MSTDLEKIADQLRSERLFDSGRLKPGGRRELVQVMQRWEHERGQRAFVVVLPRDESLEPARALWEKLGLDPTRDLLLIANGERWEARGWGLSPGRVHQALVRAAPALERYFARGLVVALDELAALSVASRAAKQVVRAPEARSGISRSTREAEESSSSGSIVAWGVAGVVTAGLVGFVIARRNRRAKERRAEFDAVRASAERAFADLILSSEELSGEAGRELQLKGGEVRRRLDDLIAEAEGNPSRMNDPVLLGKIRHIESELAALRSTGLQKAAASCSNPPSTSTSPAPKPSAEWDPSNGSDLLSEPSSISVAVKKN
jgi:hypothetical protein